MSSPESTENQQNLNIQIKVTNGEFIKTTKQSKTIIRVQLADFDFKEVFLIY